jgi:hypothetical protein
MTFFSKLWRIELVAVAAFAVSAVLVGTYAYFQTLSFSRPLIPAGAAARVAILYTLVIGCAPVVLFGAPLYALAKHFDRASWTTALCLGIIPGIALWFLDRQAGYFGIACGAFIALSTHLLGRRLIDGRPAT